MSLVSQVSALATRVATEFKAVRSEMKIDGWSNTVITHSNDSVLNAQTFTPANNTIYTRIMRGSGTINTIAIYVGTASGNISVGIASNTGSGTNATPYQQLVSSNTIACPTGFSLIPLLSTVNATPGMWMSLSCDNTTATFLGSVVNTPLALYGVYSARAAGFPAPSTYTSAGAASRRFQMVGMYV